jgi:hypothetical protein
MPDTVELSRAEADRRKKIRRILRRISESIDSGNSKEVYAVTDNLISRNTLHSWLKEPNNAFSGYKSDVLLQVGDKIPGRIEKRMFDAYGFALAEMQLPRDSQTALLDYHGTYRLYHKFEAGDIEGLRISARSAPSFATFALPYQSGGKLLICDGLVVIRRSRLYFVGLSRGAMFFAGIRAGANPANDILTGMAVFEDFNEENVSFCKVALVNNQHELTKSERDFLRKYMETPSSR